MDGKLKTIDEKIQKKNNGETWIAQSGDTRVYAFDSGKFDQGCREAGRVEESFLIPSLLATVLGSTITEGVQQITVILHYSTCQISYPHN